MSLEDTLGALLEARIMPLREEVRALTAEVAKLRRALPPLLVPLKAAALRMGVSYATARRRADAGEWPVRRDGGRILVDLTALHPKSDEEIALMARELDNAATRRAHNGQP